MKKTILLLVFTFLTYVTFGQKKKEAEKLVDQGVAYHDKGDYEGAIAKYDKALKLDKDNISALTEKALTLVATEKYEEAILCCKKAIETHPNDDALSSVYVSYGNALDGLKKTDEALDIYEEGIKKFPDYYQLHFNKGITYTSVKEYDEAISCLQRSMKINPKHPGSQNAIARILDLKNKRIPALLAYCRFLVLEPESERAKKDLELMKAITLGDMKKTGKKSITVNISSDMLADTTADGKPSENSFTATDLILTMDAVLDFDKENKKKSDVELFIRKFETVCSSLKETQKDNYGFYWDFYVPYFVEMKDKNFITTFAYIAFATSDDPDVGKWLKSHKSDIEDFYKWSSDYKWKTD